jgi:transposase-like protein
MKEAVRYSEAFKLRLVEDVANGKCGPKVRSEP